MVFISFIASSFCVMLWCVCFVVLFRGGVRSHEQGDEDPVSTPLRGEGVHPDRVGFLRGSGRYVVG